MTSNVDEGFVRLTGVVLVPIIGSFDVETVPLMTLDVPMGVLSILSFSTSRGIFVTDDSSLLSDCVIGFTSGVVFPTCGISIPIENYIQSYVRIDFS